MSAGIKGIEVELQPELEWNHDIEGACLRIAELECSPIRVMAGPGTGKTFALMRRAARLLQDGARPERILICTFTRTAARDLQHEVARLGPHRTHNIRAGTLHSFCFWLLSESEVLELTGRVPRTLLAYEGRFLLEDLIGEGFGGIRERAERLQAFNAAWARLQSEEPGWPGDQIDRLFHRALIGWLQFHEAILVGELVPEALRYLRANPASPFRGRFDHVLVDEYQDLNRAEQELLELMAESGSLIVIGDEDQSIYSFKYAHPEGIATFHQSHPDTHDELLDECRRCPTRVVEIANALIVNNMSRTERTLRPLPGNPEGEMHILQWHNMEQEAEGIARIISSRIHSGEISPGQILVLAPRRQFGYAIRDALEGNNVNAHSFFHEEAFDGDPKQSGEHEAQQAFTLLTLLANPEDRVALRCWCGFGSSTLRRGPWSRLQDHCENSGQSPMEALEELESGDLSLPYSGPLIERYRMLQQRFSEFVDLRGEALTDSLFPADQDWANQIRILASATEEDDYDAGRLRETLRVGITQPDLPTDVDYVRIMSLHKSKGLTADFVIVVGCIEGLIPTIVGGNITEQRSSLEEQRRLFYVAITRTRRVLILSSIAQIPRYLAHRIGADVRGGTQTEGHTISSRFLQELGPSCPRAVLGTELL